MEKLCFLLSAFFYDFKHVYIVHTNSFNKSSELLDSSVSRLCGSKKTFTFVSECSPRSPMTSVAPTLFVFDAPSTYETYQKLLWYCFPWINIICRVTMSGSPPGSRRVTLSNDDLKCCDSFFLDFTSSWGNLSLGISDKIFEDFEEIPPVQHGLLRWYAVNSRTLCSPCGWTGGAANPSLSFDLKNANLHLLVYPCRIYTTHPLPRRKRLSKSSENFGDLEGYERATIRHLSSKYNVTLVETMMDPDVVFGKYPDEDLKLNESSMSLVSRLLSRQFHIIYGDVTMEVVRSSYGDFSYPFDIDYLTAVSKITEDKRSFAPLADISCILCYICLSLILALYLSRLRKHGSCSIIIRNSLSLVLRPVYPHGGVFRLYSFGFVKKFVSTLHGLCALVITAVISGITITILSKKTFSGLFDSETEVLEALSSTDALILLSPHLKDLFLDSGDEFIGRVIDRHDSCVHSVDVCLDECLNADATTCLTFGESVTLSESLAVKNALPSMYMCPTIGFTVLQSFLFNKGCFLSRVVSREILRAISMGIIARFKLNAGVETYEHKRKITAVYKSVSLQLFQELVVFYCYAWLAAVVTLLMENVSHKMRNSVRFFPRALPWRAFCN